jgi:hypothetical protein
MYFIILAFLLSFFGSLIGYYRHTASGIKSSFSASGPRAISDWLSSRNQKGFVILAILVVFVAFLEALVPDVAYGFQDLQTTMNAALPEWGIVFLSSGGGISWGLYLAILLGFGLGMISGSMMGCKSYTRTQNFGAGQVL